MEAVIEKLNSMEMRVSKIEEENETLSYDIVGLKKENHNLKKEIRQLNLKQNHPTKTVQQVEDLQTEIDKVRTTQLMDIQGEVKRLKEAVKELKASQNDGQNERNLLECLKKSLNVVLARAHRSAAEFDNKMPALEKRMGQLENNYSLQKQLSSHSLRVSLKCKTKMSTGTRHKLDECRRLYFGLLLDVRTACIDPPSAGCYVVHTQMMQEGKGLIRLYAKFCAEDLFCMQTSENGEMATCLDLIELQKGQKLWFEALRLKGDGNIKWCVVNCWLLH